MSNGHRTISQRLQRLADFLMDSGGATPAEICHRFGINYNSAQSAIKDLSYWGYVWQDGKGGKVYCDYMFDGSVEGGRDLFVSIFGKRPALPQRDPATNIWVALREEYPEDTGILREWKLPSTGFGQKNADRIRRLRVYNG